MDDLIEMTKDLSHEDGLAVKKMQKLDKEGQFLSLEQVKKKYLGMFK